MKWITIVCSSGLGTSLMVRIQLEKILNEWGIHAKVTNTDKSSITSESPNLVIGAKQIMESITLPPNIEGIELENLIDSQHLRGKLQKSHTIKHWMGK